MTASLWMRVALVLFGILALLTTLTHVRGSKTSRVGWIGTALAGAGIGYIAMTRGPIDAAAIDLCRATVAVVAAGVVWRLGRRPERAHEGALTALLAATAFLSVSTFFNLWYPQFHDAGQRKPTYVHTWDLRVYFPGVKYFRELGYDGVYLASVKAYADEELGGSLEPIESIPIRDLRDYQMRGVSELAEEIHAVEQRFSPERWDAFKRDMAYFWNAMGDRSYLRTLRDHGGNATPAWVWVAHWIFRDAEASEATFLRAALIDPLLLLLLFIVAWRTFGLRPALVCIVAFGATTVYQFGSNWSGSTLRNDWMVLIGLGVCALKSRRSFLAGVLLGWAAMIRAFPVLALAFLVVPIGWRIAHARANPAHDREGSRPLTALAPLFNAAAGALLVAAVLGASSAHTFGFEESWGAWSQKISMHANRPNINHLGLTALVSFDPDNLWYNLRARGEDPRLWGPRTAQTMKERRWVIFAGMALYTWLAVLACRWLRLADAAVIGTMLIPIYFYPSNYYLHILFIWPLMLAATGRGEHEAGWTLVAVTVLAACAIQAFGWLVPGSYGQFLFWSGVLLVAIAILLWIPITGPKRKPRLERSASPLPQ